MSSKTLVRLQLKVSQRLATVQAVLAYMVEKGWLTAEEVLGRPQETFYTAPNYWKFHRRPERIGNESRTYSGTNREREGNSTGAPPNLPYPNLTKETIYIGISGFGISQNFEDKVKAEGLPDPDANLLAFVKYHEPKGKEFTQEQWESLYLNQLRYLKAHSYLRADTPPTNNFVQCEFIAKNPDQIKRFGDGRCKNTKAQGSKMFCQEHKDYYEQLRERHSGSSPS